MTNNHEQTLILIKPDGVQRRLIGSIISRFEQKGLQLAAAKFLHVSKDLAEQHYAVHKGKSFYDQLVAFLTSSPCLAMVWRGPGAIQIIRKMLGATFGPNAEPGTIRGDFGCSKTFNLVHASDMPESAAFEIGLYFKSEEIVSYEFSDAGWLY